jgi:hypothetical protein
LIVRQLYVPGYLSPLVVRSFYVELIFNRSSWFVMAEIVG